MGMAVDSNVLVYERIREEARNGRPLHQAIDIGFKKAFATIMDANVTALIAAVVLFYLGSGPVRGFAVTLTIGIATTVFTAFTMTFWLMANWYRWKRPKVIPKSVRTGFFDNRNIRFMAMRKFNFGAAMLVGVAWGSSRHTGQRDAPAGPGSARRAGTPRTPARRRPRRGTGADDAVPEHA
eukprot:gene46309-62726_t